MTLTIGSLFSGVGGLELGLEWAGLGPVRWQVEQDEFCCEVLAHHWPSVRRYRDVRVVGARELEHVDIVCGGFPCQDVSLAGSRAGLAGERSGLWTEYARIVRELRPRFVVVENVAALASLGLDTVLGDLAALGYDAWWDCVRASDVGAPHRRERLFIVAYATGERDGSAEHTVSAGRDAALVCGEALADTDSTRKPQPRGTERSERRRPCNGGEAVGDTARAGLQEPETQPECGASEDWDAASASDDGIGGGGPAQSGVGRDAHGLPDFVDGCWPARPGEAQGEDEPPRTLASVPRRQARLKALGNAVVPQVAYAIGCVVRAIAERAA